MADRRGAAILSIAAIALLGGCADGEQTVEGPVSVYVSLPLSGPRAGEGNDAADGARLALEQAGGRAGDLEVQAEFLDDASADAAWDPVLVGENARAAAQDSSTAAYIGELDSEPTRASLPITNEAGIVQISPGAGGVDLTRAAQGYPDSPDRYQPSGEATFVRLAAADDEVARAAVRLAADEGQAIRIIAPDSPYGDLVADVMTREAESSGFAVNPGGEVDGTIRVEPDGAISVAGRNGVGAVTGLIDPANLADAGFASEFRSAFAREPGPYAAYGYEAMQLALQGIDEAQGEGEFRPAVRDAVLGAQREDSALGPFTVSDDGESGLCSVQPYSAEPGDASLRPSEPDCAS